MMQCNKLNNLKIKLAITITTTNTIKGDNSWYKFIVVDTRHSYRVKNSRRTHYNVFDTCLHYIVFDICLHYIVFDTSLDNIKP